MTIEQKISVIIEDCCAADPSLHGREAELRPIVRALLEAQPDTKFDKDFAARLRKQVLAKAKATPSGASTFFDRLRNLNRNDVFVLGGAALGLVLAVTVASTALVGDKGGGKVALTHVAPSESFRPRPSSGVIALNGGAFGDLHGVASQAQDTGRGSNAGITSAAALTPDAAMAPGMEKMLVRPPQNNYRFVYKGDIAVPGDQVTIYRRVKGFRGGSVAGVTPMVQGIVDLSRLEDPKFQNFSLIDDRDYGYNVYADALEGVVAFSAYWQRWPHPESQCRDEACFLRYRLKPEQLPTDAAAIDIADKFLADYGVSRDGFGAPEVHNEWKAQMAAGEAPDSAYVPETLSVVYPVKIDALTVDEGNGGAGGMTVSVNVRHMRVDGAWGITSNAYESSSYAAESDASRLRSFLEKGGVWGVWQDPEAKTVDIAVGDPTTVLVRVWKYLDDGTGDELFVPALRFPIIDPPSDGAMAGRTAVLVPLAKDAISDSLVGQPMPLTEPVMIK
ncbi:MAG TPA: hypothetical protein VL500_04720 [Candidatus Eisenbacteria bacterium]|jgi:hypothetical protein|nr:hypothetical protein [Candidatus Eisenbacteria bacterium]